MAVKPIRDYTQTKEYKADRMLEVIEDRNQEERYYIKELRRKFEEEADVLGSDISDETYEEIANYYRALKIE